jgi:hypothetical protein
MLVCQSGHRPVVYDDFDDRLFPQKCPVCQAMKECEALEEENRELRDELNAKEKNNG